MNDSLLLTVNNKKLGSTNHFHNFSAKDIKEKTFEKLTHENEDADKDFESSVGEEDLESIRFFDKIKMRTNSISHSKIPKLNLNFNNLTTKNETYVKKKHEYNVKNEMYKRNLLQKPQTFGYSTIAEFKQKKNPSQKKKYQ